MLIVQQLRYMTQSFGLLYHENGKRCKCVIYLLPFPKAPSFLLIPIRKNLPVFLPGKVSISIRRNPHFTRQP